MFFYGVQDSIFQEFFYICRELVDGLVDLEVSFGWIFLLFRTRVISACFCRWILDQNLYVELNEFFLFLPRDFHGLVESLSFKVESSLKIVVIKKNLPQ